MAQPKEGTPPPLTPEQAQALIQSALGGSTGSDTITVEGGDGNTYLVNKSTGKASLVAGVPGKPAPSATKTLKLGSDGKWYLVDESTGQATPVSGLPADTSRKLVSGNSPTDKYLLWQEPDGKLTKEENPNYVEPKAAKAQQPKVLVSGSNPSDKTIVYFDPDTGKMTTENNPNYVDPAKLPLTPAQTAANAIDTSRLGIEQQNANTSAQNTTLQAARDQVDAEYKRIQAQVAQGTLSNSQAIERFKEVVDQFQAQRDALTTAMTAGDNAARYAEMATKNAVGPQFGAHFAQGLQGVAQAKPGMVNYGPSDFTYPTPDYQGIAAKATAAALAHLSPFAAQLAQQHQANQGAAIPGYQPRPAPTPDVIGQAAASVVGQQPGYRPAGG